MNTSRVDSRSFNLTPLVARDCPSHPLSATLPIRPGQLDLVNSSWSTRPGQLDVVSSTGSVLPSQCDSVRYQSDVVKT